MKFCFAKRAEKLLTGFAGTRQNHRFGPKFVCCMYLSKLKMASALVNLREGFPFSEKLWDSFMWCLNTSTIKKKHHSHIQWRGSSLFSQFSGMRNPRILAEKECFVVAIASYGNSESFSEILLLDKSSLKSEMWSPKLQQFRVYFLCYFFSFKLLFMTMRSSWIHGYLTTYSHN